MSIKDGKGGSKGRTRRNPSLTAIRRKRRSPHNFGGFDVSLTDAGEDATTITDTGSQAYVVPRGVDKLTIEMVGGGGGGGDRVAKGSGQNGGGGGSGAKITFTLDEVTPGSTLTFNVGTAGAAGTHPSRPADRATAGGDTTLVYDGITYTAGGGAGGAGGGDNSNTAGCDESGGAGSQSGGTNSTFVATTGNNGTEQGGTNSGTGGLSTSSEGVLGAGRGGQGETSSFGNSDGYSGWVKIT